MYLRFFFIIVINFVFISGFLFIASTGGPIQPFNFSLRYYDFYGPGDFVLYRNKDRAFEVGVTMTCIIILTRNTSVEEPREARRSVGRKCEVKGGASRASALRKLKNSYRLIAMK